MMRTLSISEILAADEIRRAFRIYESVPHPSLFAARCKVEVVLPALSRVERQLGQEMDALWLSYAIGYVIGRVKRARRLLDDEKIRIGPPNNSRYAA